MGFYEFLRSVFVSVVRPSFFNSVLACRSATFRKAASSTLKFTRVAGPLSSIPREHFRKFCFLFLYPSFCQIISSFLWFVFCCRRIFWHILTPFYVRATCRVFLTSLPRFSLERPEIEIPGGGVRGMEKYFICFRSNFLLRRTCSASPSPCAACCGVHYITVLSYQRTAPPPDRLCSPASILFCGELLFPGLMSSTLRAPARTSAMQRSHLPHWIR